MTTDQLLSLLTMNGTPTVTINGITGILQSVERESGNGRCFNVRILRTDLPGHGTVYSTTFVRTVD